VLLALLSPSQSKMQPVKADLRPGLSIVTLNLAKESSEDRILTELRAIPELKAADVFLFQEVSDESGGRCIANRLGAALGMHVAYSPAAPGSTDLGLAILSRFPLREIHTRTLKSYNLRFHTRARFALVATADTPWGPVRVSNAHLDTRLNVADRLAQLEPVVQEHAGFRGGIVVGGDFNSNPFYWIEHVLPVPGIRSQARGVEQYMTGRGFRTALPVSTTTFDHLGMHLDWIWVNNGLRPTASRVFPLEFSDHHAVWTRAEI
jgi:endonuclease/exonuclease/phosphatase family metal-dependent hydrolase